PAAAMFLGVRWTGRFRALALVAGVAVLLLNLCVSDGLTVPAVAIPLWVAIALALRELTPKEGERAMRTGGQFALLRRIVPLPISAALVMVYGGIYLLPTAQGARYARQAFNATADFARALNAGSAVTLVKENRSPEIRRDPV